MGPDPMNPGVPLMVGANRVSSLLARVEPDVFIKILKRMKEPLVVVTEGGVFRSTFHYLTSYKGIPFYTKSNEELSLPLGAEVVTAEEISIPD